MERPFPEAVMRNLISPVLLTMVAAACSGPSSVTPSGDPARFAGKWTYQSGSIVLEDCANAPEQTIDLSKAIGGQPAFFTMTTTNGGIHEVDARGCQYDWDVSADVATAVGGQSCGNFPDGHGGTLLVRLQSGKKSMSDVGSLNVDVHFATDAPSSCNIHVQGTAIKS